jgi:hypothetical protein
MAITRTRTFPVNTETVTPAFNQRLVDAYCQTNASRMFQPVPRDRKYIMKTDPVTGEVTAEPTVRMVVQEFQVGDVEEPDLYAAQALYDWQHSEQGQWVLEHAIHPPTWHSNIDHMGMGYRYRIVAEFAGADATWLTLSGLIPGI